MKRKTCLSCLGIIALSLGLIVLALCIAVTAQAAPACPGPGTVVEVVYGATLNVRTFPGGPTAPNNARPLEQVTARSGKMLIDQLPADGYLHLAGRGWIVNQSLSIVCASDETPSATLTRTATSTPRPTMTSAPVVTPTQIRVNTVWCSTQPEVRRIGDAWFVECRK